jgi:hypothetical protein
MDRIKALHWAEIIDAWRVFPRLFLTGCFYWTVRVTHDLLVWYTMLPKEDRGIEASGFASVALLGVLGFLKLVYSTYSAAGRSWAGPPPEVVPTVQPPT